MSQTLLRIAKLLPMLGTTSDNERLVTLAMIEKVLRADGLSFTDAGQQLGDFVRTILAEPEPEPIPAPEPPPAPNGWSSHPRNSWTSASAPPPRPQPAQPQPQATRPTWTNSPPPPRQPTPPRTWTESVAASAISSAIRITVYEERLSRYLNLTSTQARPLIKNKNERQFLEDMYFRISSGTDPDTLTTNQKNWLHDILNRAPITF